VTDLIGHITRLGESCHVCDKTHSTTCLTQDSFNNVCDKTHSTSLLHLWMSLVAHNHTFACQTRQMLWCSNTNYAKKSFYTYERVMSHIWMVEIMQPPVEHSRCTDIQEDLFRISHITYISCHTRECVTLCIWMCPVTHNNGSRHTAACGTRRVPWHFCIQKTRFLANFPLYTALWNPAIL